MIVGFYFPKLEFGKEKGDELFLFVCIHHVNAFTSFSL